MNIYLAGMIGVGKTTVGRRLATHLGWPFADFDQTMEAQAGKNFREVVAEEGWLGFRQREYLICKHYAASDHMVAALGGGTVRYQWNLDALHGTGVGVLLVADLETLAARVRLHDRPRVIPGTTLEEDIRQMWAQWGHLYYEFADVVYHTDEAKTPHQEALELAEILRRDYGIERAGAG